MSKILYGLFPKYATKPAKNFIDQDYIDDLMDRSKSDNPKKAKEAIEALEWLAKFNDEYYLGYVNKGDVTAIHSEDEKRKSCYNNSNRIRRDVMNNFTEVPFDVCNNSGVRWIKRAG